MTVFIDDFVPVPRSLVMTNACLISHGHEIARAAAATALAPSDLSLGLPRTRVDALVIPLMWSSPVSAPFRQMAGDLETARLGPTTTHLRLSASCDLAVPAPGRRPQELAAMRSAEQVVRAFLAHMAGGLEQRAGPDQG